jgi:EmrB/QacA subfamily drug resistance transporter
MTSLPISAPSRPRATTRRSLVLALVLIAQFMVILDATIVTVALPSIQTGLGFDTQLDLQWVINAYILLFGGALLLGGRAGDLFGRRRLFMIGLTLFSAASLLNGLAQSTGMLVAGRAVQGLGAALVSPAVLSIIVATFDDEASRAKALGVFSAVTASGSAAGLLLGGILTDLLSWRWIFLVNVPVGVAAVLLALRHVPESRADHGHPRHVDLPGAVTVTGGLTLLVYALVNAQHWGWSSASFILTTAGAALLLAAFTAIELRSRFPLVRLGIFANRSVLAANLTMFLLVGGQFTMMFFPTLYLQDVHGYTPIETGLAYVPWPVAMAVAAGFGQKLIGRFGVRPPLVVGLALSAAGLLTYSGLPTDGSYVADVLPGMLLTAVGAGLAWAALFLAATHGVAVAEAGLASGLINTAQQIGSALGLAALATVAATRTADLLGSSPNPSPDAQADALVAGFQRGFTIGGVIVAAAALVALVGLRHAEAPAPAAAEAEVAEAA